MNVIRSAAAAAVAAGLVASGVALATPASAVGSSACTRSTVPVEGWGRYAEADGFTFAKSGLSLRNGPGTTYKKLGLLKNGTNVHIVCTSKRDRWLYGRVVNGANKGKWGWVAHSYTWLTP